MHGKPSVDQFFGEWQRQFAADAVADNANEIRRHIEHLGLECAPADLLAGTEMLLLAVIAYSELDGRGCERLIKQQRYWLRGPDLPFYCLTFNFGRKHFGRILTDEKIGGVDFADLFNHPWYAYQTAGFHEVHISRLDGQAIGPAEFENLEARFTEDMYFDSTDEEISAYVQMTELEDTALATAVDIVS